MEKIPKIRVVCELTVAKRVVIFLKNHPEEFFNKTDAFSERLQQFRINKRNI